MSVALVSVFTALALGTNYVMIDLWNVKLMDALVFVAAFLFGLRVGLGSAISTWLVYGFVNPYGQADPLLLLFLITGECFYAIAGSLLSHSSTARELLNKQRSTTEPQVNGKLAKINESEMTQSRRLGRIRSSLQRVYLRVLPYRRLSFIFGLIGFQATFAFDVLTNFGSWIFKTTSLSQALIVGIITGVPFAVLHEASNLIFFATVAPIAIVTARRLGLTTQEKSP